MDSVDKLREYAAYNCRVKGWKDDLKSLADGIEAEIAERYMELPVDADGVPIRVGDEMMQGDKFKVCAVAPAKIHRWCVGGTFAYDPSDCIHYKPRTLEDVLTEMLDRKTDGVGLREFNRDFGAFVAHYADEIRELLAGDSQ